MLWQRVIKLRERCLCQAETSGHLITDKWGLVLATARINPFCKHSYPNLLNMSFQNFTKMQMWFPPVRLLREIDLGAPWRNVARNMRTREKKRRRFKQEKGVTTCTWPTARRCPVWSVRATERPRVNIHGGGFLFCCLPSQQSQNTW